MKNAILSEIEESRSLLNDYRNLVDRLRYAPSPALYDMLHTGAEMAGGLLGLAKEAHRKGIIDDTTLRLALRLANEWLVFDDEVEEMLVADLPAKRQPTRIVQ